MQLRSESARIPSKAGPSPQVTESITGPLAPGSAGRPDGQAREKRSMVPRDFYEAVKPWTGKARCVDEVKNGVTDSDVPCYPLPS